jgi:hypothetical protein
MIENSFNKYNPNLLTENSSSILFNLPETGMGFQIVKVILRSGNILRQPKVLNSELLMLEKNENVS